MSDTDRPQDDDVAEATAGSEGGPEPKRRRSRDDEEDFLKDGRDEWRVLHRRYRFASGEKPGYGPESP